MTFDPFADDVQPEPVVETSTTNDVFTETVEVQTVTSPEGVSRISLTFKAGASFDSPWVVVEGGTVPGVLADLKTQAAEVGELFGLVAKGAQSFQKGYGGASAPAPQSQNNRAPQGQPGQPQGSMQAPNGETHYCRCGDTMKFVSGFSQKTNKSYAFFACPKPQYSQCQGDNGRSYTVNYKG